MGGSGRDIIEVLSWCLPGRTQEYHEKRQSEELNDPAEFRIWHLRNMKLGYQVGESKHNTLLRCKVSKDRQHVSALFYKAIIRSDMVN